MTSLTQNQKIGIGIGAGVGGLLLIVAALYFMAWFMPSWRDMMPFSWLPWASRMWSTSEERAPLLANEVPAEQTAQAEADALSAYSLTFF